MIDRLVDELRVLQNADGGWGALRDRQSNTEATSLATLALTRVPAARAHVERGLDWLRRHQDPDGSWPFTTTVPAASWTTPLAMLALSEQPRTSGEFDRGVRWLLEHRGRRPGFFASLLYRLMPNRMPVRLDPSLRGWAWTTNEFSWVEPTSYAILVLKKTALGRAGVSEAVREGEAMLYDRVCPDGGWNYGNSVVFGEALAPYPDTTALALIALQDRRGHAAEQAGYAALRRLVAEVNSGLTLAWSSISVRLRGDDAAPLVGRLRELHATRGFRGETRTTALALLAAGDGALAFKLDA
jgi:hypothetical protein